MEERKRDVEGEPDDVEMGPKGKRPLSKSDVRNSAELTLEYKDSNIFEGLVTAFLPRKRAKISQRRIACMSWRFHCGI